MIQPAGGCSGLNLIEQFRGDRLPLIAVGPPGCQTGSQTVKFEIVIVWIIVKSDKKLNTAIRINRLIVLAIPGEHLILANLEV